MRNATANKKTTFTVVSNVTGKTYTRKSFRAYTHAVVSHKTTDAIVASLTKAADREAEEAIRYEAIAMHLTNGTTPEAGSILLKPTSMCLRDANNGCRTEWDVVTRGWCKHTIEQYREWTTECSKRMTQYREEAIAARATNKIEEGATFHHSAALAHKALAGLYAGRVGEVIELSLAVGN